jgi:tetratricopeptide (TPR) repeat protein
VILQFPGVATDSKPPQRPGSLDLDEIAALYEAGEGRRAVEELKRYLSHQEDDDLGWTILAHAYVDRGMYTEAEKAYTVALELNGDRFEALTGMGILARKTGDSRNAFHCYLKALHLNPGYAPAYSSLAVLELQRGRDASALEYALKAFRLDPLDPTINANLAVAYHYLGKTVERDASAGKAEALGYPDMAKVWKIFSGELTVRDARARLMR